MVVLRKKGGWLVGVCKTKLDPCTIFGYFVSRIPVKFQRNHTFRRIPLRTVPGGSRIPTNSFEKKKELETKMDKAPSKSFPLEFLSEF
jgi:hypothetical protein